MEARAERLQLLWVQGIAVFITVYISFQTSEPCVAHTCVVCANDSKALCVRMRLVAAQCRVTWQSQRLDADLPRQDEVGSSSVQNHLAIAMSRCNSAVAYLDRVHPNMGKLPLQLELFGFDDRDADAVQAHFQDAASCLTQITVLRQAQLHMQAWTLSGCLLVLLRSILGVSCLVLQGQPAVHWPAGLQVVQLHRGKANTVICSQPPAHCEYLHTAQRSEMELADTRDAAFGMDG